MAKPPAIGTLIDLSQKFRHESNLPRAKLLLACTYEYELEGHAVLGNYLVPMLVDCGCLLDGHHVFSRLPHRNEYSWNSLISGFVESGEVQYASHLYDRMQQEHVQPNSHTFVALLKACTQQKDVQRGDKLRHEIARRGLERSPFVGNSLVDLYAKCGYLEEAREMFEKLPARDRVSWTALISGYADHGFGKEALRCFEQMQLDDITPDAVTYVCSLKACASIGDLDRGRQIRAQIASQRLEGNLFVGNMLVDMFGKCGSLTEAQEVFDKLPTRDKVTWNTIIARYAEHGFGKEAMDCFRKMELERISPNDVTFVSIVKACGAIGAIDVSQQTHTKIIKIGLEADVSIGHTLVAMYGACNLLEEAHQVFAKIPVRNAISWNALVSVYVEHGLGEEVLYCFEAMQQEGAIPDVVTFGCNLKVCGSLGAIERGFYLHAEIVKRGFESDLCVGRTVLCMYMKCDSLIDAEKVFDQLPVRDAVVWTALSAVCAENQRFNQSLDCFQQMQLEGVSPDANSFVCGLKACASIGDFQEGQQIHAQIVRRGLESDLLVGNTLIDMLGKCGAFIEAHHVLDKLSVRDRVSWNVLIAGYAEHGLARQALSCFEKMQLEGVPLDVVTFVCTLKACACAGAIEKGSEIHSVVTKLGLENDISIANTLIDMLGKCGSLREAQEVFYKLSDRDVVSWNALITGLVEHGFCEEALNYAEQMCAESVPVSSVTFISSLKACGCITALERGKELHSEIVIRGLELELHVANTLVDMYVKCSSLAEAHKVSDKLPSRNVVSWTSLIAGYAENRLGHEALKCLEQMQEEGIILNVNTVVCSLKACGTMGALDKGHEVHTELTKRGFDTERTVGNALVDMYSKCGSLVDGQKVFDKLPDRDIVTWNAMIKGYGENHEVNMAVQCFNDMLAHNVKPDPITFTCLLVACSHSCLVTEGQQYFEAMREEFQIEPTLEHYVCMVDLLARSGRIYEAQKFVEAIRCPMSEEILTALLDACKVYGELELGVRYFQQLMQVNPEDGAYLLMADVYASAGRQNDASKVECLRKHVGVTKKLASASIEVHQTRHEFLVGEDKSKEISKMLSFVSSHMKYIGYIPQLDFVSRDFFDERSANVLYGY